MNDYSQLLCRFVIPGLLAPEIDPFFYRLLNADLAKFDDTALRRHFERHGRSEGRCASPAAHRAGFVTQIPDTRPIVEIGPGFHPTLRGSHVRYFDLMNRADALARAPQQTSLIDEYPEIDYVSPTGDLSVITDRFDALFSSHCIEHQPDLVAHLQRAGNLLKPLGRYFMLVPDKRYCFDALIPESTLDKVPLAHHERRRVHTYESVLDHYVLTTHNDTGRHWRGDSLDEALFGQRIERAAIAREVFDAGRGGYVDVHAWQFTPQTFRTIITELNRRGLTRLAVERVYDTVYDRNEFGAVLHLV